MLNAKQKCQFKRRWISVRSYKKYKHKLALCHRHQTVQPHFNSMG